MQRVRGEMVPYLLDNKDAFFSALTLIMVPMGGGRSLKEGEDFKFIASPEDPNRGTIVLEDHVLLFPADGMHRSAAIKEALLEDTALSGQHVAVVLIPFKERDQVRQLFSDLNLNVKPVSKTVALNFEIREPVAILPRA